MLDLSRLDAKAANLNLMIDATEKLDVSVAQVTGQIACPVETSTRLPGEGIRNEFLCGQRSGRLE